MQSLREKWSVGFMWVAIIQGVFAVIWTLFVINPCAKRAASMVIAEGSAGTWLLTGYALFIRIGVVAVAVTALFHYFIEEMMGKVHRGFRTPWPGYTSH